MALEDRDYMRRPRNVLEAEEDLDAWPRAGRLMAAACAALLAMLAVAAWRSSELAGWRAVRAIDLATNVVFVVAQRHVWEAELEAAAGRGVRVVVVVKDRGVARSLARSGVEAYTLRTGTLPGRPQLVVDRPAAEIESLAAHAERARRW